MKPLMRGRQTRHSIGSKHSSGFGTNHFYGQLERGYVVPFLYREHMTSAKGWSRLKTPLD